MRKSRPIKNPLVHPAGVSAADVLAYLDSHPEASTDLVEGLIGPDLTVIFGDPKAGKSMLSLQVGHAIATGADEFWGRPIARRGLKVAVATTDPGGVAETAKRLRTIGGGEVPPIVLWKAPTDPGDLVTWQQFRQELLSADIEVLIFDNLLGVGGGDFNRNDVADIILRRFREISDEGISLVVVAHSRKRSQHVSASILGSVQFTSTFRTIVRVEKQATCTKLEVTGNHVAGKEDRLMRDPDTGILTPVHGRLELVTTKPRKREPITPERLDIARQIVRKGLTLTQAGQLLHDSHGACSLGAGKGQIDRDFVSAGLLAKNGHGKPLTAGPNLPER